jgi:hypothetical protein
MHSGEDSATCCAQVPGFAQLRASIESAQHEHALEARAGFVAAAAEELLHGVVATKYDRGKGGSAATPRTKKRLGRGDARPRVRRTLIVLVGCACGLFGRGGVGILGSAAAGASSRAKMNQGQLATAAAILGRWRCLTRFLLWRSCCGWAGTVPRSSGVSRPIAPVLNRHRRPRPQLTNAACPGELGKLHAARERKQKEASSLSAFNQQRAEELRRQHGRRAKPRSPQDRRREQQEKVRT